MINAFCINGDGINFRMACNMIGEEVQYSLADLKDSLGIQDSVITLEDLADANNVPKSSDGQYWVSKKIFDKIIFEAKMRGLNLAEGFKIWVEEEIEEYNKLHQFLPQIKPIERVLSYLNKDIEVNAEGMWNASQMATIFNKKVHDWTRLQTTKVYLSVVAAETHIPETALIQINRGGNDQRNQGSWIHEKLVVEFARWLNPKFAYWCNTQIETLLREGYVDLQQQYEAWMNPKHIQDWIRRCAAEVEMQIYYKQRVHASKAKLAILNSFLDSKECYRASEVASMLGFRSAQDLNQALKDAQIQHKVGKEWILNAKYQNMGYTETKLVSNERCDKGYVYHQLLWTPKGIKFLRELLRR